jgi:hypothetical protein
MLAAPARSRDMAQRQAARAETPAATVFAQVS